MNGCVFWFEGIMISTGGFVLKERLLRVCLEYLTILMLEVFRYLHIMVG